MALYRHTVSFLEDISPDGTLDPEYSSHFAAIPASIVPKSGGEVYRGVQIQAETTNVIECRYIAGLKPNMIIRDSVTNQDYLIRSMLDVQGRQREWLIQATEVVV